LKTPQTCPELSEDDRMAMYSLQTVPKKKYNSISFHD